MLKIVAMLALLGVLAGCGGGADLEDEPTAGGTTDTAVAPRNPCVDQPATCR